MEKRSSNQIKLGMILSYINLGIGNLIPFFYTPIMLELMGQSEFGLYKIAGSTTSYLSLMAFGIGAAVSRFLIKARVEEGKEAEQRMFGLFNLLFGAVAVLTLVAGGGILLSLDWLYGGSLTAQELGRMRILVGILTANTALNFSATSYNTVVSSHERFLFIQCCNILTTIGAPVLNLVILYMGYRSIGMAMVSLAMSVIVRAAYVLYVRKALDMKPLYRKMPRGILKDIFAFSGWVFLSTIVGQIYSATDMVIIGAIPALATVGAAIYSVGNSFNSIMFSLSQIMPSLFAPMVNKMVFSHCDNRELSNLMIRVGRMQCVVLALGCSGFVAFGKPFLDSYVGPGYEEAYWVAVLIMIPNCIPLMQSIAHTVIQAKNMHQFRSMVYLAIAVLNVVATALLVNRFGIVGAAIPTGGAYLLGHGLIMNWYYWKKVGLDIPRFWKQMLPIVALSVALCAGTALLLRYIELKSWITLLSAIGIYTVVYGIALWTVILTEDEKKAVLGQLLRKLKKKA